MVLPTAASPAASNWIAWACEVYHLLTSGRSLSYIFQARSTSSGYRSWIDTPSASSAVSSCGSMPPWKLKVRPPGKSLAFHTSAQVCGCFASGSCLVLYTMLNE